MSETSSDDSNSPVIREAESTQDSSDMEQDKSQSPDSTVQVPESRVKFNTSVARSLRNIDENQNIREGYSRHPGFVAENSAANANITTQGEPSSGSMSLENEKKNYEGKILYSLLKDNKNSTGPASNTQNLERNSRHLGVRREHSVTIDNMINTAGQSSVSEQMTLPSTSTAQSACSTIQSLQGFKEGCVSGIMTKSGIPIKITPSPIRGVQAEKSPTLSKMLDSSPTERVKQGSEFSLMEKSRTAIKNESIPTRGEQAKKSPTLSKMIESSSIEQDLQSSGIKAPSRFHIKSSPNPVHDMEAKKSPMLSNMFSSSSAEQEKQRSASLMAKSHTPIENTQSPTRGKQAEKSPSLSKMLESSSIDPEKQGSASEPMAQSRAPITGEYTSTHMRPRETSELPNIRMGISTDTAQSCGIGMSKLRTPTKSTLSPLRGNEAKKNPMLSNLLATSPDEQDRQGSSGQIPSQTPVKSSPNPPHYSKAKKSPMFSNLLPRSSIEQGEQSSASLTAQPRIPTINTRNPTRSEEAKRNPLLAKLLERNSDEQGSSELMTLPRIPTKDASSPIHSNEGQRHKMLPNIFASSLAEQEQGSASGFLAQPRTPMSVRSRERFQESASGIMAKRCTATKSTPSPMQSEQAKKSPNLSKMLERSSAEQGFESGLMTRPSNPRFGEQAKKSPTLSNMLESSPGQQGQGSASRISHTRIPSSIRNPQSYKQGSSCSKLAEPSDTITIASCPTRGEQVKKSPTLSKMLKSSSSEQENLGCTSGMTTKSQISTKNKSSLARGEQTKKSLMLSDMPKCNLDEGGHDSISRQTPFPADPPQVFKQQEQSSECEINLQSNIPIKSISSPKKINLMVSNSPANENLMNRGKKNSASGLLAQPSTSAETPALSDPLLPQNQLPGNSSIQMDPHGHMTSSGHSSISSGHVESDNRSRKREDESSDQELSCSPTKRKPPNTK